MIRHLTILVFVLLGLGRSSYVPVALPPHLQQTPVAETAQTTAQAAAPSIVRPAAPVTPAAAATPASPASLPTPVIAVTGMQDLHREVLGMAPQTPVKAASPQVTAGVAVPQQPATQPALQPPAVQAAVQPALQPAMQPPAVQSVSQQESNAAATAATAATNAANAAVVAANTAANAAASANKAASAAASANANAALATSPAQAQEAATNAANAAVDAANVAVDAAASANIQAGMAASAAASAGSAAVAASDQVATAVMPITEPEASWSSSQWYVMRLTGLFAGLSFAMFVKALCVAGNVLVQVSPFPQVRRWTARGCTGEADAAPYVSIAFGGCQWCFYGLFAWLVTQRAGFLILVHSNCLGAVLGTYYVMTFFRNCRNEDALSSLQKYLSAVTALALLQVCALSVLPAERALFLVGIISSFCSFINATSVLVTAPTVIRNKDSRSIPGPYAIANLLSSMVWSLCGFILADPCVMMPNVFSTLCAAASLGLKYAYPSKEDEKLLSVEEGSWKEKSDVANAMAAKKALSLPDALNMAKDLPLPKEFTPLTKPTASKISAGTFETANCIVVGKDFPIEVPTAGTDVFCGGDGTGGTF